jgi:hypothetical protein
MLVKAGATYRRATFRGTLTRVFTMLAVATLAADLSIIGLIWASPAEEGPWGMWAVAEPGYEGLARIMATVAVGIAGLLVAGFLASIGFLVAEGPHSSRRAVWMVPVALGLVLVFGGFIGVAVVFGIALVVVGRYLLLTVRRRGRPPSSGP